MTDMERIEAPFTDEQVLALNRSQRNGMLHGFTCCSPESVKECTRAGKVVDGYYVSGTTNGTLQATRDGWVCPCGKMPLQEWAYAFMLEDNTGLNSREFRFEYKTYHIFVKAYSRAKATEEFKAAHGNDLVEGVDYTVTPIKQ